MISDLAQEAVNAALSSNWQKAIELNSKILELDPENIDALNRVARAYAESDNLKKAKELTNKVLKLDSQDPIANRCAGKWKNFKKHESQNPRVPASLFIENLSKGKIISLVNLGDSSNLLNLDCGDKVLLVANMHKIGVITTYDKYIGKFPDNMAAKFIPLIKNGNAYEAIVKSATKNEVKILIKTD